jgi:hypothetical protein
VILINSKGALQASEKVEDWIPRQLGKEISCDIPNK